jgi:hypothetical protein
MASELRHYTGPDGQTLVDLLEADLPDPDTPAPVRLQPAYDNAVLGPCRPHAHHQR